MEKGGKPRRLELDIAGHIPCCIAPTEEYRDIGHLLVVCHLGCSTQFDAATSGVFNI